MELLPHLYFAILRFTNNFPWHLNLVIVWKFCILSHFNFTFLSEEIFSLSNVMQKVLYERILKIHTFPTAQLHEIGFKNYLICNLRSTFRSKLKMISSPYCAVSEPNVYKHYKWLTRWNANRCYSLRITYLIFETFQTLFPTASLILLLWRFSSSDISGRMKHKASRRNGGWHESLNLLHVSRCEMLNFVTLLHETKQSLKQTLKSAQYRLEISFNAYNLLSFGLAICFYYTQ